MANSELICVAIILLPHGLKGDVKVKIFTDNPYSFFEYKHLWDKHDQRMCIEKSRYLKNGTGIVKFDRISDRNQAESARGEKIYVRKSQLNYNANSQSEVLYYDLVKLDVINQKKRHIGRIIDVYNYGAGDLLEIKLVEDDEEILIPFHHPDVGKIDYNKLTVEIQQDLIDSFRTMLKNLND